MRLGKKAECNDSQTHNIPHIQFETHTIRQIFSKVYPRRFHLFICCFLMIGVAFNILIPYSDVANLLALRVQTIAFYVRLFKHQNRLFNNIVFVP